MCAAVTPTLYRFTREEYDRMIDLGLLVDKRVELLDGEIIAMPPHNPPHASKVGRLTSLLFRLLGMTVTIRGQLPIVLDDWSEPQPDIAVCQFDSGDYEHGHPKANEVLLVIEVSESTLAYDRGRKVAAYAGSGIPEYWIVNLVDRRIEVFSDPDPTIQRYRQERFVVPGDTLTLLGGLRLAVGDVL